MGLLDDGMLIETHAQAKAGKMIPLSMFNKILMCIHPDSSASADTRREVLQFLQEHKDKLVVEDKPEVWMPPPYSLEEKIAMRKAREAGSARAKAMWAKRREQGLSDEPDANR